jgi:anti-sigma regulatory factor (Ser/Thr protein kinase)
MGDTVGSGVRAASVMGQLRGACRIYAGEGHEPAEVVRSLNRFALSLGKGEMATLIYLVLDPDSGQAVLVNAGHPPPLVRHADGRCEYLGPEPNLPLGVQPSARYVEHPVELPPDATVLLYTDGLTERRDRSLDEGFEHLAAAMGAAPTEPQAACEHVLRAMLGNEQPNDDVALLALHRTHVAAHGVDLRLPAEASALPHLRRVLRNWLDQVGADDQESYDIVLATSEAAANVSEHAYGPAEAHYEVKGTVDEGIVQIAVRDFGRWRPPRGTNRGRGLLLMNALTDDVAIHHGGAGTEVRLGKRLANPTSTSKETALVHH